MFDFVKGCFSHFLANPRYVEFAGEDEDEKIVLLARRHIITNVPWIIAFTLMLFAPVFLPTLLKFGGVDILLYLPLKFQFVISLLWYLITFAYAFEAYLNWYFNVYIVTDKRLIDIDFYGAMIVNVSEAPIATVQDVSYSLRGIAPTLFNYGSVIIETASERGKLEFELVPTPAKAHDIISDLATEARHETP